MNFIRKRKALTLNSQSWWLNECQKKRVLWAKQVEYFSELLTIAQEKQATNNNVILLSFYYQSQRLFNRSDWSRSKAKRLDDWIFYNLEFTCSDNSLVLSQSRETINKYWLVEDSKCL